MRRYTIQQFERDFSDDPACLEWLRNSLYPEGIFCKICRKITRHHRIKTRHSYSCDRCGHHVHPTAGTIFAKSRTGLRQWFRAIYLMASTRTGVSARRIQKETGVTYKTAWRMLHQIRLLLAEKGPAIGHAQGRRASRKGGRGTAVSHGPAAARPASARGTIAIHAVKRNKSRRSPAPEASDRCVLPAGLTFSNIATPSPRVRTKVHFRRIHHPTEIRIANAHPRSIPRFSRLLKTGIGGVYRVVSAKYLQTYLDEYAFRYNHRSDPQPMFCAFLFRLRPSG
jgi:transposase-like protein